jgi:hypothetical protein
MHSSYIVQKKKQTRQMLVCQTGLYRMKSVNSGASLLADLTFQYVSGYYKNLLE